MRIAVALIGLALVPACSVETSPTPEARVMIDDTLKQDLTTLRGAHVFFGHHSVGQNILEGLAELSKEAGIDVKIDEARVGQNTRPLEKFEDFAKRAERDADDGTQLMLMKLCYVDFIRGPTSTLSSAPTSRRWRASARRVPRFGSST